MIKQGLRLAAALVTAITLRLNAQVFPPDGTVVQPRPLPTQLELSANAEEQISQLAKLSYLSWTEQFACVTSWRVEHREGVLDSQRVEQRVIVVQGISSDPEFDRSDSMTVWHKHMPGQLPTVCSNIFPTIHTHLPIPNTLLYLPSPLDLATAARTQMPFAVLVSIVNDSIYAVRAYGIKREESK